jgi:hypothetical protein
MAARRGVVAFFYEIQVPVLLAVAWAIIGIATANILPESPVIDALWLSVRLIFVAAAGYLVTRGGRFGLVSATIAGAVVMFADHVIVKGGSFLVSGELEAAAGVVVSYIMFIWVDLGIGLLGGLLGRVLASRARSNAAI